MSRETGYGTYSYKTGVVIEIVDGNDGYNHKVYQAGKPILTNMLDPRTDDPIHASMWVEIGCPTPRQMGFNKYCEADAVREQFEQMYPGVDIEHFVGGKIAYHDSTDWCECKGEGESDKCLHDGCNLQDFVESAAKRGVTIKQVFRDKDCRCKPCRRMGF